MNQYDKTKIMEWLCKKHGIKKFSIGPKDYRQKFIVYAEIDYSFFSLSKIGFYKAVLFIGTCPLYVERFDKIEIFDSIIESAKDNDIFIGIDYKFLEHGTTYEQLAIEADLDCWYYLKSLDF